MALAIGGNEMVKRAPLVTPGWAKKDEPRIEPQIEAPSPASDEPTVTITLRVTDAERREFKAWCAMNGLEMREAFRLAFQRLKDG
jgi:hypothetical protein